MVALVINQPRTWVPSAILLLLLSLFVLSALPESSNTSRHMFGITSVGALLALSVWIQLVVGARSVRISLAEQQVVVSWRNVFFIQRRAEFPLSQFGSVVSCIERWSRPLNRVELLTTTGSRALLLAQFPAAYESGSFWGLFARETEAEDARNLRLSVARTCGLVDGGFIGKRISGAQVL
jgi:hypothetical protein